nr:uncharacterized protein LOC116778988 [Danaus plexippus plexippus]
MNKSDLTIPSSPLSLYVKIYCKKRKENKSKTNNILEEATKSWLTLSTYEKQQFITKYEQLRRDINKQFAEQLKNAIPYLKKKVIVSRTGVTTESKEQEAEAEIDENNINNIVDHSAENGFVPNTEENIDQLRSPEKTNNALEIEIPDQSSQEGNENYKTSLSEPIPPKLINGQQLFELVNENADHESWTNLTKVEKRRYQSAVLAIKKNYLKDYIKYLEHLPSEKLYKLYKNNIPPL